MGNARSALDQLVYIRAWTAQEVAAAQERLRRKRPTMVVDRATFGEVVGTRHSEAVQLFEQLDADCDGRVDTFEVLLTLTLWSCATWEEKVDLLFRCFDFNGKGVLRFAELAFMASTTLRVMDRFAVLPPELGSFQALKEAVATAFGGAQAGELGRDGFVHWFANSEATQRLRGFVDAHLGAEASEAVEALVRERVRMLEYNAQEFSQELAQLRETSASIREEAQYVTSDQEELDTLWMELDSLMVRLGSAEEAQRSELQELATSMAEDVSANGPAALLEPESRSQHGRLIKDIADLEQHTQEYLEQAKRCLGRILEILRGADSRPETPTLSLPALPPPPQATRDPEEITKQLRLLNRELRRRHARRAIGNMQDLVGVPSLMVTRPSDGASGAASQEAFRVAGEAAAGAEEAEEPIPLVVAFADFEPPPSSDTPMLTLRVGDEITPLGQDEQGWWYGRKADGSEGWFPPSYVQAKGQKL